MTRGAPVVLLLWIVVLGCGRVGPPVRASEREPEAAATEPAPQAPAPAEPEAEAQETQP